MTTSFRKLNIKWKIAMLPALAIVVFLTLGVYSGNGFSTLRNHIDDVAGSFNAHREVTGGAGAVLGGRFGDPLDAQDFKDMLSGQSPERAFAHPSASLRQRGNASSSIFRLETAAAAASHSPLS